MTATIELMTYQDLIDHLVEYQRANPSQYATNNAKRAILAAYRNFPDDCRWSYYYKVGRICTVAPYDTGTVTFDYSGGNVERELTLTDGVWPEWAAFGTILIGEVAYDVADRLSGTRLQLEIDQAPTADITTATGFTIYRDTYALPVDFRLLDEIYTKESWLKLSYVHPREWLVAHRYNTSSSNSPLTYTITGSPNYMGALAIRFYPYPDSASELDYIYQRRPRPLRIEKVSTGEVNMSSGDTYLDLASGDVTWSDKHLGSVIRLGSSNDTNIPTGREMDNPYQMERVIMDVNATGNQITVDQQAFESFSNATYVISDPIDVEPGVMTTAFLRRCELELAILTRMSDRALVKQVYDEELDKARAHDSRVTSQRSVESGSIGGRRLAYMNAGPDVD